MRSIAQRHMLRGAAGVLAAAAIVVGTASPGAAAAASTLAYSDANALTLNLLGTPVSTGTVVSTTNGTTTTTTGNKAPSIALLTAGQSLIPSTGVLAQNANAYMVNTNGTSAACAGLAGQGGSVVAIGQPNCLAGGKAITLTPDTLSLTDVVRSALGTGTTGALLGGLANNSALSLILGATGALSQVTTALDGVLNQATGALDLKVGVQFGSASVPGAVSAGCTAVPGANGAKGGAAVAPITLVATVAGQTVSIPLSPANPAPNFHVGLKSTDVSNLTGLLTTGLSNSIAGTVDQSLGGQLGAVAGLTTPLLTQLQDLIKGNLAPALSPLLDNPQLSSLLNQIINGTLNYQKYNADHSQVSVKALQLNLLTIANGGIQLTVGSVDCGPNFKKGTPVPPKTCQQTGTCPPPASCASTHTCPPQVVPSGRAFGILPAGPAGFALLGLVVVAAAGAGMTSGLRALRR